MQHVVFFVDSHVRTLLISRQLYCQEGEVQHILNTRHSKLLSYIYIACLGTILAYILNFFAADI